MGRAGQLIASFARKELLVALEEGGGRCGYRRVFPAIVVPETLDPINLLGVLRARQFRYRH